MSDGKEVKRWGLWRRFKEDSLMVVHGEYDMSQLGPCDTAVKVMPVDDHDRIVAERNAEQKLLVTKVIDLSRYVDELLAEVERIQGDLERMERRHDNAADEAGGYKTELTEARAEVERLKSKDSELIKCLQYLTGANNQINPHLGVAAGVALMKAELTDSNKTIATQAREAEVLKAVIEIAKRVLHNAGLRPPDGGTPTVETICEDLNDAIKEIAAIEKEGEKDE